MKKNVFGFSSYIATKMNGRYIYLISHKKKENNYENDKHIKTHIGVVVGLIANYE